MFHWFGVYNLVIRQLCCAVLTTRVAAICPHAVLRQSHRLCPLCCTLHPRDLFIMGSLYPHSPSSILPAPYPPPDAFLLKGLARGSTQNLLVSLSLRFPSLWWSVLKKKKKKRMSCSSGL